MSRLRTRIDRAERGALAGPAGHVPILFCLDGPGVEPPAYTLDGVPVTAEEVRARYGDLPPRHPGDAPVSVRFVHVDPTTEAPGT